MSLRIVGLCGVLVVIGLVLPSRGEPKSESPKTTDKEAEKKKLDQARALITKLGDDLFEVREKAHKELEKLGRVIVPLLKKALTDDDLEVRRRARNLLAKLNPAEGAEELIKQLGADSFEKREGATRALLKMGPAVIGPLKEALKGPDLETRNRAKRILQVLEEQARKKKP
jgi:HEAT repeat protein